MRLTGDLMRLVADGLIAFLKAMIRVGGGYFPGIGDEAIRCAYEKVFYLTEAWRKIINSDNELLTAHSRWDDDLAVYVSITGFTRGSLESRSMDNGTG
jgi:hypothetical protein